jgi:hypothetical protein
MKKLLLTLGMLLMAAPALAVSPNIRIAQVYTGGGTTGAAYKRDYVVLFNNTGTDVDISGWVLCNGTSTGNWVAAANGKYVIPAGTWIAGCGYLLVTCGPVSAGGLADLTGDLNTPSATLSLAGSNRIGLFTSGMTASNFTCNAQDAFLVDKVAWGTTNCPEGTAAPNAGTNGTAERLGGGTVDTDDNLADFVVVAPNASPVPKSAATPTLSCAPVATEPQSWGGLKSIFR